MTPDQKSFGARILIVPSRHLRRHLRDQIGKHFWRQWCHATPDISRRGAFWQNEANGRNVSHVYNIFVQKSTINYIT
jgi:hypothetical protein